MRQFVVDAFTDKVFAGNQAAICLVDAWPSDDLMMAIARENNFSETAVLLPLRRGNAAGKQDGSGTVPDYALRWFTPGGEIDLCGHATLASAFVVCELLEPGRERVTFDTMSGALPVSRSGDLYEMDFPAFELRPVAVSEAVESALGCHVSEAWLGRDLLCVLDDERTVRELAPDQGLLKELDGLLCHVTARGHGPYDCVSRSFAPKLGVAEDPVCGSGHCHILPYWSQRLGMSALLAYQASARGGEIQGEVRGDRVTLGGKAVLFSTAELSLG